jgi:hypothetical protein
VLRATIRFRQQEPIATEVCFEDETFGVGQGPSRYRPGVESVVFKELLVIDYHAGELFWRLRRVVELYDA